MVYLIISGSYFYKSLADWRIMLIFVASTYYKMKKILVILLLCLLTIGVQAQLKPRVVILTDIGQPDLEPDDTESLVHLLCYADLLEIEGIITCEKTLLCGCRRF